MIRLQSSDVRHFRKEEAYGLITSMMLKNKKIPLLVSLFAGLAVMAITGGRANAATLAITNDCTLSEAITAVNGAADGSGCVKTGAVYGTDDTINLAAGTTTLSADLPSIAKAVTISGQSASSTIIQASGNKGFFTQYSNAYSTKDVTIKNLTVSGATPFAVDFEGMRTATIEDVVVTNSDQGIRVRGVEHTIIKDTLVTDCSNASVDQGEGTGVVVRLGTQTEGRPTDLLVEGLTIKNSSGDMVGMLVQAPESISNGPELPGDSTITIRNTKILNNNARLDAGLIVVSDGGPLAPVKMNLGVEATTIANNTVTVTSPQVVNNFQYLPIVAGFLLTGALHPSHHFVNVTVANNIVNNPSPDNRTSVAGFVASLGYAGSNLEIVNATVVGNKVTQPSAQNAIPAFYATKVQLNESFQPINGKTGSSAKNVLLAQNFVNGTPRSCFGEVDTVDLGFDLGILDLTPVNLGNNMSDDQTCTGYTYEPGLYNTIAYDIADNGGPVPTIKLLPGSPAINGGGVVAGINTDARGVARTGYYSVGAYQGELLAATTDGSNGKLANTGMVIWVISIIAASLILVAAVYTYIDYRRHRKPLVEADPHASQTYTYRHHVSTVTIPLMRYRISISLSRQPKGITRF